MGNVFRRLMSMLSSKKLEVVLVGLENSGKTTLLQVWSSKVNVSVVICIDVRF
jgi:GTPase SAR1 family protein